MIRDLEVRGLSAWPAAEVEPLDGWLLCASGGHTRRTNSVQTWEEGSLPVDERIDRSERFYRERGQAVHFKLTEASEPRGLDAELERRGYAHADPTSVQVLDLDGLELAKVPDVAIERALVPSWFEACARLNDVPGRSQPALRGILDRIRHRCAYASLDGRAGVAAVALGVLDDDHVGLFEIATAPDLRGRGLGTDIVRAVLRWARGRGARRAWLQCVVANERAQGLYEKLGFREAYRYWYRSRAERPLLHREHDGL